MLCALAFAGWHAADPKAEAIEADIAARASEAVAPLAAHPIEVETDGRDVRLAGVADSAEARDALIDAARAVRGVRVVEAAIEVLPAASPYVFTATKATDGTLTLAGHAPSEAVRDAIVAGAKERAGGSGVVDEITLATGVPDGDWQAMIDAALASLEHLNSGSASLADLTGAIVGAAPSTEELAAAARALEASPGIDWTNGTWLELGIEDPYRFEARMLRTGPVRLSGYAPSAEARDALTGAAEALRDTPPAGGLIVALPGPAEDWEEKAAAGLDLLAKLLQGTVMLVDQRAILEGQVETDPEAKAIEAAAAGAWELRLTVLNPDPASHLTIRVDRDGGVSAEGRLPRGFSRRELDEPMPDLKGASFEGDGGGAPEDWSKAAIGVAAVLPRFREAEIDVRGDRIRVTGQLSRGFNAEEARSALRSAAGPAWTVEFDVSEAPPEAVFVARVENGTTELAGILPAGLTAEDVTALFPTAEGSATLTGGGEGDAETWQPLIAALARIAPASETLEAKMRGGELSLAAALRSGYTARDVTALIGDAAGDTWETTLDLTETEPAEGDVRVSLATGETEDYHNGFWMPRVSFAPDPETCSAKAGELLEQSQVTFVTGSAEIDTEAQYLINRLAAIALNCLAETGQTLVVGGHTDTVGDAQSNIRLSRDRANAVADALAARGVPRDHLLAFGYGSFRPVADNETEEGRAKNRRITFAFIE